MRLIAASLCVAALASLAFAQGRTKLPADSLPSTLADKPVPPAAQAGNAFAFDLYKKLALTEDAMVALKNPPADGNLFFSPASIHVAMAMTYAGAGGDTAKQMEKTLHLDAMAKGYGGMDKIFPGFADMMNSLNHPPKFGDAAPYQLVMANALWGQKGFSFKPNYIKLVDKQFEAALNPVDFAQTEAARKTINDWVADKTKDKIKDLIAQGVLDAQTRLVLTNAVYFKSNWEHKFDKNATKDDYWIENFAKANNSDAALPKVPMMNQKIHIQYMEDDNVQAIALPYMGEALSMVIILPKKRDSLPAVEKALSDEQVSKIIKAMAPAEVNVTIPKFTFSSQFSLNDVLQKLGIADAFNPAKADFSGMVTDPKDKLFITAVIHKAFVAVDENGTEAAAATAVAMALAAMPPQEKPKEFKADHPFVFLIRQHETEEILFLGRVMNPKTK